MGPDGMKMSKSKGNVIDPDSVVAELGSDTVRMYLAFIGPFNEVGSYPWSPDGIKGIRRFLDKVWKISEKVSADHKPSEELLKALHQAVAKVEDHTKKMKFNTAISELMILIKSFEKLETVPSEAFEIFITLLSPFAPHMAEEIWSEVLGKQDLVSLQSWPEPEERFLVEDSVTYGIQVNGKLRADITLPKTDSKEDSLAAARAVPNVAKYLEEGTVVKEIFVPGKIIGFVVK